MGFFKEVEGNAAVVVERGVYRQVPLYTRDGYLFAKVGSGFVRLMADGSTTKSHMRLDSMTWDGALYRDPLGRLTSEEGADTKPLAQPAFQRLLGIVNAG